MSSSCNSSKFTILGIPTLKASLPSFIPSLIEPPPPPPRILPPITNGSTISACNCLIFIINPPLFVLIITEFIYYLKFVSALEIHISQLIFQIPLHHKKQLYFFRRT